MDVRPLEVSSVIYNNYKGDKTAHLQSWFMENKPKEEMLAKAGAEAQILFIRDKIREIMDEDIFKIEVVSTHFSKSIKLPVYHIIMNNGMEFIMRGNFHNWIISVISPIALEYPDMMLGRLSDEVTKIPHSLCEGFQSDWIFDPYSKNKKKFTLEIDYSLYELYTFFYFTKLRMAEKLFI